MVWYSCDIPHYSIKFLGFWMSSKKVNYDYSLYIANMIVSFLNAFMCPPSREITNQVMLTRNLRCFIPSLLVESPNVSETPREYGFHKAVTKKLCRRSKTKVFKISFSSE